MTNTHPSSSIIEQLPPLPDPVRVPLPAMPAPQDSNITSSSWDILGLLFNISEPLQMAGAWGMLLILAFFPCWIFGASLHAIVHRYWMRFHPAIMIATCLHIGRIPFSAGTWGTLFTVWMVVWLVFLPRSTALPADWIPIILFVATALSVPIGIWASNVYVQKTGKEDPSEVVIDELSGMLIAISIGIIGWAILLNSNNQEFHPLIYFWWVYLSILFAFFRLFDIWKPWVIGKLDTELSGGWGIMADDLVAGVFAGISYWVLFLGLYYSGGILWLFKQFMPEWVGSAPTTPLP